MQIATHETISMRLCGQMLELSAGYSRVALDTVAEMAVDAKGLVHGGFVFGLADYAAMIAVNHPNVVLGASQVRFLKPVRVGELLEAEARVTSVSGRRNSVQVTVTRQGVEVMQGEFTCFVLEQHVLEM